MTRLELRVWGNNSTEVKCSYPIMSGVFALIGLTTDGVNLDLLSGFFTRELLFSPHTLLFGSKSLSPACTQRGELHILARGVPAYIVWNSSVRKIHLFSPMYLIQSFTYISMDSHIYFLLWVIIQYCVILLLKLSLLWLFQLGSCVPLTCSCHFTFWALPYFLTLKMLQAHLVFSLLQL